MELIDTKLRSQRVIDLQKKFASRIVGQEEAIEAVTNCLEKYVAGLSDPFRPIASLLFLGPTGTGKTSVVEALCEGLYGSANHMVKIDCAEFQYGHEIAKLIGSPPGYLGHKETPARFTTKTIKDLQTIDVPFTILLFDEIEKASDDLWQLLLGILDKGKLTLGDNSTTDFTSTMIFMTSNVGARRMAEIADSDGMLGFASPTAENVTTKEMADASLSAAKKKFTPEFLNRLDEIVTFQTLTEGQLQEVLGMEIRKAQDRFVGRNLKVNVSPAAMQEIFKRGYDKKYNARGIRRAVEKNIVTPVARALSCGQLLPSESAVVDFKDGAFTFYRVKGIGAGE